MITEYKVHLENKTKYELIGFILQLQNLLDNKDKIINLIAEQLAGLTIWNTEKDEPLILTDKEEVINYFENKVNSKIQ